MPLVLITPLVLQQFPKAEVRGTLFLLPMLKLGVLNSWSAATRVVDSPHQFSRPALESALHPASTGLEGAGDFVFMRNLAIFYMWLL